MTRFQFNFVLLANTRNIFGIRVAALNVLRYNAMGTRLSLQTSLWINSLSFNSGKVFNITFLVENKDSILQRWSPTWIRRLQTTNYCVRMVIVLSSTDESLIQVHVYQNSSFLDSRSLTFVSLCLRCLLYKEVPLVNFKPRDSRWIPMK